jgi:hypothetical protein
VGASASELGPQTSGDPRCLVNGCRRLRGLRDFAVIPHFQAHERHPLVQAVLEVLSAGGVLEVQTRCHRLSDEPDNAVPGLVPLLLD